MTHLNEGQWFMGLALRGLERECIANMRENEAEVVCETVQRIFAIREWRAATRPVRRRSHRATSAGTITYTTEPSVSATSVPMSARRPAEVSEEPRCRESRLPGDSSRT